MNLPTLRGIKNYFFGSKKRTAIMASFLVILLFTTGFLFNKQLGKLFYEGLGKMFPGAHVKVEGTEVKGFADGKKVDHLAGIVKNIEPSTSGTRLTIEWEGDEKVVLVDPRAYVYFGPKKLLKDSEENELRRGDVEEIEIGDSVLADFLEDLPNGEVKTMFVTVVR